MFFFNIFQNVSYFVQGRGGISHSNNAGHTGQGGRSKIPNLAGRPLWMAPLKHVEIVQNSTRKTLGDERKMRFVKIKGIPIASFLGSLSVLLHR